MKDRKVIADAIAAGARYLITTDVDDVAFADLARHEMSAVNADYSMALRLSERASRKALAVIAGGQKNPPRTEAELHRIPGRRHPRLTARFSGAYDTTPVQADSDQPSVVFRGVACIRCEAHLDSEEKPARRLVCGAPADGLSRQSHPSRRSAIPTVQYEPLGGPGRTPIT
ncbi:hypothetical protein BN12_2060006 [Nostocoides japonicum T1-X7]|uniref:PIN domain-containing protein n=1 Tax=Nostocoides japonicum T1-X7 TaxID=1194083 RepID=A0A077LV96_9MICO|nr:hypothetical protein [Tetrasphaera japonica]CCH77616.1 hypothetical protein BN12_2060006 [Tetrasphaera japonica T1-X7]